MNPDPAQTEAVLVGRHHNRPMTVDEIAAHNQRWQEVEPWALHHVEHLGPGSLLADAMNEIDRLRFLLSERERADNPEGA